MYRGKLISAVVEVTNRCNLRCPHCASASGCPRQDELSLEDMKAIVRDLATLGCRHFTMLGGEFLLRTDWYEIAKQVKDCGIGLQLITNGLLVTSRVREMFKTLDPEAVGVSIDGATSASYKAARGVDGFGRCRELLDGLVSDGLRQVSAITTFTSRNLCDFDKFAALFRDTRIVWQVQMVHKAGERFDDSLKLTEDQYAEFVEKTVDALSGGYGKLNIQVMDDFGYYPISPCLRFLCERWNGCPAGRHVIGIRANGDVLPCLSLGSDFVEDNAVRRSLVEIWRDQAMFARFRRKSRKLTGDCARCPFAVKCKAGCSAAAISNSGVMTENRFCVRRLELRRILLEALGKVE